MPPLSSDKACEGNGQQMAGLRSGLPDEGGKSKAAIQPYPAQWPPEEEEKSQQCKRHPFGPNDRPGMKYVQPAVPPSYKPESRYRPSTYQMESGTVYKLSYPGVDADTMMSIIPERAPLREDNIRLSTLPFSQDTTFRLSYTGAQGDKVNSCKPAMHSMMGKGPMQSITTHRHDYTPKTVEERPTPFSYSQNIHLSTAKMEENTTMRLSYQPVEAERVQSYKPVGYYRKPDYKFEQDTVHRLSYQPWEPLPKEEYHWKKLPVYQQSNYTMENNTVYRASYLPNESIERAVSYKPVSVYKPSDRKMAEETIYRESYQNAFDSLSPVVPVKTEGNIHLSTLPMSQDTTFRLSYTGVTGDRAIPCKPGHRTMMGKGPMQSVTTQRHDYTPKPFIPTANFKPKNTLVSSDYKMEDMTTFRASYMPNDPMPRPESYKPISVYRKPNYTFESDTVNKLSYQPWEALPKEEYPWTKKPTYQQPTHSMEGCSIYRGSYIAPGNFVPDDNSFSSGDPCTCKKGKSPNATDDL